MKTYVKKALEAIERFRKKIHPKSTALRAALGAFAGRLAAAAVLWLFKHFS